MQKILVVEDDSALAVGLKIALTDAGYLCEVAESFRRAKMILEEGNTINKYSLLIFDVMLPDGNGHELLRIYRNAGVKLPVIFLTAVSDEESVVKGLDLGADDYITKPFRNAELLSRVRAVLRRYENIIAAPEGISGKKDGVSGDERNPAITDKNSIADKGKNKEGVFAYGELVVDTNAATVTLTGKEVSLSSGEYKLLLYFLKNQGICLSRSKILEKIFDESGNFVDDSALYVYVNRLRDKIGDLKRKDPYIKTVRGIGYRMEKI
ncbi:DNA-binding response regulator, OmpR family, contains REC and winged-helix (wHTH) domain [Eubacterium ruminantium]|nr:DNA-binding response regulator, OmpR family, contains REC and winged-helix (wHTH) domain [Eubacterium ruminantium]